MALGICVCPKHGRMGWDETCEHLDTELKQGIYGPFHYIETWAGVRICEKCWQDFNMEYYETHPEIAGKDSFECEDEDSAIYNEYYEEVYEKLKRGGWCLQCLAEIEVTQARRNGAPDPFPVYEKTLGTNDTQTIAALRRFLVNKFPFHKAFEFPPPHNLNFPREDPFALSIRAGAFTFPLILTVYFVTEEAEQERLLQLIREFLNSQSQNQAKVKFYEAEVWELVKSSASEWPGIRKGEEKLLREVRLNC